MENISTIILKQIQNVLIDLGQDLNNFTWEQSSWNIKINEIDPARSLDINYQDRNIVYLLTPSPDWLDELNTILRQFIAGKQWIVELESDCCAEHFIHTHIHKPCHTVCHSHVINGFTMSGTEATISNLAGHTGFKQYHPDGLVQIQVQKSGSHTGSVIIQQADNSTASIGSFITRLGLNHSSRKAGTGTPTTSLNSNVQLWVIDTGIQPDHPDLNVNVGLSRNFVSTAPPDAWADQHGHGTHVSGIAGASDNGLGIVGIAPNVNLVAVRVLGADGVGYLSDLLAGMDYVVKTKKSNPSFRMVVNMSLSGGRFALLDSAVNRMINAGVVVAVAAGNSSDLANRYSPAAVSNAITVGAYDTLTGTMASWSNYGTLVDVLAPGVNIESCWLGSRYAVLSGTSMATPMVAGTVACLMSSNPTLTAVSMIVNRLKRDATRTIPTNYDRTAGTNPNIKLSKTQTISRTTNRSVYGGMY